MSLLISLPYPNSLRRSGLLLAEEPHFDPRAVRRAIKEIEREAIFPRFAIRSELAGFSVEEARRALSGLPAPGDYKVVIKPLRYRTRPHLAALCEFDERRITLNVPVPFRPFDELVYYRAKRRPGPGMRFTWFGERVRFPRRAALRVLPRVAALVLARDAGAAVGRGDGVRPVCLAELPAAPGDGG